MLYTQLMRYTAIPVKFLPSIKKGEKQSSQLLYFWYVMRISRITGILLILLFANIASAVAQDTWSLQRCVDYALQNNLTVKQQVIEKRLADLTLKQSQLGLLPNLSGTLGGNWTKGRSPSPQTNSYIFTSYFSGTGGLDASVDIFNWFSKVNTMKANRFDAQANSFLLEKARNDLAFNVATSFLQILLNMEQVKVNEVQVSLTNSNLENTKKLVIAGSVPESNQADLEAQLAQDSTNLVTAKNDVILSTLQVKAYLNLGFDIPFVPEVPENIGTLTTTPLNEMAPEMVYSKATTTYPLLKADELRIESANKNFKATRAQLYPKLTGGAGISAQYASNSYNPVLGAPFFTVDTIGQVVNSNQKVITNTPHLNVIGQNRVSFRDQLDNTQYQYASLRLAIPIFNGWQARAATSKAKLNVQRMELTRDLDNQKLKQDIYTAHANAVAALQKFNASTKGVAAAQKAYDFATKRFNLGLMNTIDYITTQSKLFRAQIDKVSAQYDYIFKMKLLEFYRDQKISL